MPAGNSSSRPSGRSSGRSNSTGSGRTGAGRPSSGGRSSSSSSRSGSGRPASGRSSDSRSGGRGGSNRSTSSDRPNSGRSSSSRATSAGNRSGSTGGRSSSRPVRDGDRRPRRDGERSDSRGTRTDSRGTGRPRRDDDRDNRGTRGRRPEGRGSDDRRPRRDGDRRPSRDGDRRPRRDDDRAPRSRRPESSGPAIPDHITGEELHRSILNELRSLPDGLALRVSRHLATCVELASDDPELAWQHAKAAFDLASRISIIRETAADAAYNAGHFAEALSHYRAVKRMTGKKDYWPLIADCERALGRPQKAIAMASDPIVSGLSIDARVEMRIVVAGARLDQGNPEAALATLQCPELTKPSTQSWAARIRYAYADVLEQLGRTNEALEWFHRAATADVDQVTDADERIEEIEAALASE